GDGGVDLILTRGHEKTFVQCKHWKRRTVEVDKVRELLGAKVAGRAHRAALVTTGRFTIDAERFASDQGIDLVDGVRLLAMLGGVQQRLEAPDPVAAG